MFGSCGRHVCLRSQLIQSVFKCPRKNAEMRPSHQVRHSTCGSQGVRTSNPDVTVLTEQEPGRSRVRVTIADNPAIIVCHHPPNKVQYSLTRPVEPEQPTVHTITDQQEEIAKKLMIENPIVWDRAAIAQLFNVSPESVSNVEVPESVSDKQKISKAVLESWPETDQTVFQAYISNSRLETRNKLLSESPHLFEFCQFNREEELAKIKLYGLSSDFPDVPQIYGS